MRYALYYTSKGGFASRGAAWLGWDIDAGRPVAHPDIADLDLAALTQTPRRYGFHGTIKAPFSLADGLDAADLFAATQELCRRLEPVHLEGLEIAAMGRFLAFVPLGNQDGLRALAGEVVQTLDTFRAPASEAELARRRQARLTPEQENNLTRWGYPHAMAQFRFHITLTGRMPHDALSDVKNATQAHFADALPRPFAIDALTLVGERPDGQCVTIHRFPLTQSH